MKCKNIMIQGTGSGVGKSVIVSALCRIFKEYGFKVAPFKSQNMALNSFVTKAGEEIGRAQATQAEASGIEPTVEMNPVLLKPTTDIGAQVIVMGKPIGNMKAVDYQKFQPKVLKIIKKAYKKLSKRFEIIVIEGAGNPAEPNLLDKDIVNMKIAEFTDAPVILVADIDKGGAFASIIGTLELLPEKYKKRISGFIINKFRGDKRILKPALVFLEKKTGKPVYGVIPYFHNIRIQEEDSVALEKVSDSKLNSKLTITVIYLPHISNFTDFDVFYDEKDVNLKYCKLNESIEETDCLIIPGSKNTIYDLELMKKSGIVNEILNLSRKGIVIVGICGGYQMLGKEIQDSYGVESKRKKTRGLGLLNISTKMEKRKTTSQIKFSVLPTNNFLCKTKGSFSGYEIHHGRTKYLSATKPIFRITGNRYDGATNESGQVFGTYIHGIFDNDKFRQNFLNYLRIKKGIKYKSSKTFKSSVLKEEAFKNFADIVRKNLNIRGICSVMKCGEKYE